MVKVGKGAQKKRCCRQIKVCIGKKCKIQQGKCYWRGCLKSQKKISKCIRKKLTSNVSCTYCCKKNKKMWLWNL